MKLLIFVADKHVENQYVRIRAEFSRIILENIFHEGLEMFLSSLTQNKVESTRA